MKKLQLIPIVLLSLLLLGFQPALAQRDQVRKLEDAIDVLNDLTRISENSIPIALLQEAHGIAVIPGMLKVGLVVAGRRGSGVITVRQEDGRWSRPSFLTVTGGSFGLQAGVQSADIVLVFRNRQSVERIARTQFTIGGDASAAAGPVGRQLTGGTDARLKAEILSYSRSRGLFAGVAFDGAVLKIDDDANALFYGEPGISPDVLLFSDSVVDTPEIAATFQELLYGYTSE